MGRSYVVKGVRPPRNWRPKAGDVVYIEGKRTRLGAPTDDMFSLRPAVDGTTAMSERCLFANVRTGGEMNSDKPQAFVKGPRKDGKYAVQYVYPLQGKRIHKVITREQLTALVAEQLRSVRSARMKSIIAEYANTRADFALLVAAIATLPNADDEEAVRSVCHGVLIEFRELPEVL